MSYPNRTFTTNILALTQTPVRNKTSQTQSVAHQSANEFQTFAWLKKQKITAEPA